jgi:hypothetical protein
MMFKTITRGVDTPAVNFSATPAMADVRVLAARPYPVGSAGHARVRTYLFPRIEALG